MEVDVPIDPRPDHESSKSTKSPIESHYTKCIGLFTHLIHLVKTSNSLPPQNSFSPNVAEALGRFRVWAGNVGVHMHRTGRVSLDYHLREASHIHVQVMNLLTDLLTDLEKGTPLQVHDFPLQFAAVGYKLVLTM